MTYWLCTIDIVAFPATNSDTDAIKSAFDIVWPEESAKKFAQFILEADDMPMLVTKINNDFSAAFSDACKDQTIKTAHEVEPPIQGIWRIGSASHGSRAKIRYKTSAGGTWNDWEINPGGGVTAATTEVDISWRAVTNPL
jgi:hypothetical protein